MPNPPRKPIVTIPEKSDAGMMSPVGTSCHFGAMQNLVAIGAKRTSTKAAPSSSILTSQIFNRNAEVVEGARLPGCTRNRKAWCRWCERDNLLEWRVITMAQYRWTDTDRRLAYLASELARR
jgi:hypothetical protein